jgi:hypothetical protein
MGGVSRGNLERLAPYIPEPTIAKPALEWILAAERPALLREVAEGIGRRPSALTAVLHRLADKDLIRRWQQVMDFPHNFYPARRIKRKVWLYAAPMDNLGGGE